MFLMTEGPLRESSLLYGRRRIVPFAVGGIALACYSVARSDTWVASLWWSAVIIAWIVVSWRCWKNPRPPGYQRRIARAQAAEREFGNKVWHKVAIGIIATLVGTLVVAAIAARTWGFIALLGALGLFAWAVNRFTTP